MAYYDKSTTFGVKVDELRREPPTSCPTIPETVKEWINRHGGLTTDMKKVKNGPELW